MTLASMGCHPLSVITALTVQDTAGVEEVLAIDSRLGRRPGPRCSRTCRSPAFKLGVLGSVENIAVIAEIISDYPDIPVIVDPVLASGRGDPSGRTRK
jgi:hydroxymethylpyrimidine/phosphomethylpyrimidine kinase